MIIANKYKIIEKIGEGCFGFIFKGENIRTFEKVAIKMESILSETKLLKNEAKIYQYLHGSSIGFPTVKWFGIIDNYYYMVLPLLGDSLCNKTFPIKLLRLPPTEFPRSPAPSATDRSKNHHNLIHKYRHIIIHHLIKICHL